MRVLDCVAGTGIHAPSSTVLQWSRDVIVYPRLATHAELDASTLGETQYCASLARDAGLPMDSARIYESKELDEPLTPLGNPVGAFTGQRNPGGFDAAAKATFVVDENGVPLPETIALTYSTDGAVATSLQEMVAGLRFTPPRYHGRPVKARTGINLGVKIVRRLP